VGSLEHRKMDWKRPGYQGYENIVTISHMKNIDDVVEKEIEPYVLDDDGNPIDIPEPTYGKEAQAPESEPTQVQDEAVTVQPVDTPKSIPTDDMLDVPEQSGGPTMPPGPPLRSGLLSKVADVAKNKDVLKGLATGALVALAAARGNKHIGEAMKELPVQESTQLDAAWRGYMSKMREASEAGLSAEERTAAMNDLSEAYNLGVKNVMRASGGNRATFLANAGVLNANRVKGLLNLSAMDAAKQRDNLKQYGAALQYQQQHQRMSGEFDARMAYSEAKRQSDLHGDLGSALMNTAIQETSRALAGADRQNQMDAYANMLDSKLINAGLQGFTADERGRLNQLLKDTETDT
jgi:hypothetical protein